MDFYTEFKKLVKSKPHNAVSSRAAHNCSYGDYIYYSKNAYLSYFLMDCADCYYSEYLAKCRDCVDCAYLANGELCYECLDCNDLYNCSFLEDCHGCCDCDFCLDCIDCKNCFGCFGLRRQQFRIFNKPYAQNDWRKKVAALKKNPLQKILKILIPEFEKHPRLFARQLKGGERSLGDYIYFSDNCYQCFNVRNTENCAYVSEILNPEFRSLNNVDCDFSSSIELCYDCHDANQCNNCSFINHCSSCSDCNYCCYCYNCQDCLGCAYLTNKQYCILNRQFTRDEYFFAINKIKEELKNAGVYGKSLADILK